MFESVKNKIRTAIRPSVALSAVMSLFICVLSCTVIQIAAQAHNPQIVSADSLISSTVGNAVDQSGATVSGGTGTATSPPTISTPVQTCVPAEKIVPAALELTDSTDLKPQIDAPTQYQVFGTNFDTLRAQILQCAPKSTDSAVYAAETKYQLTWRYSYSSDNGVCRITQASVGLHVMQTMPAWTPPAGTQSSVTTKWNGFIAALTTHENGHTALDVQYAQQLLNDLRNFPATPCGQLPQSVKLLASTDVSELAQANDNYDSSTDHGATQGAILPQ